MSAAYSQQYMKMLTHLHDRQYISVTPTDERRLRRRSIITETMMRRATFALALALAIGSFASMSSAAPTDGPPPPAATPAPAATPTPSLTKPAKLTPQQRALRACAKMKGEQAKADCRAHAQAKAAPRKVAKRKPVPPAPAPTPAAVTN
jgi:hypothetical protein